ncbi:MAG: bi-domain-containing oxidoreductase [Acidobacteriota bacterium]
MRQLLLDRKSGQVRLAELPEPALRPGTLLVRTAFSAISPGTEGHQLRLGRDSLLATARSRPDLVRRLIDTVRRDGLRAAWNAVEAKRESTGALGYSSAGHVLRVGPGLEGLFEVGQAVACAGEGHASHSELACVPAAFVVPVPSGVPLRLAAFGTLGSVALHATRLAEPGLAERHAVIGLGLVGQLCAQLLATAGARVIGFDPDPRRVELARLQGFEAVATVDPNEQAAAALAFSDGVGVDSVIVAASSRDDGPMVAAAGAARDRGRVVAVGLVPHALPREIAYAKELELRIARSYGPGRHDPDFEDRARDYPIGQVRWTVTRNLDAFLQLLSEGSIDLESLIEKELPLERGAEAYEALIEEDGWRPLGILLDHGAPAPAREEDTGGPVPTVVGPDSTDELPDPPETALRPADDAPLGVAVVGAGAFARGTLLPLLARHPRCHRRHVVTAHGASSEQVARRHGFDEHGTALEAVLDDPNVQLVLVLTRHDLHAELAARVLATGRHVLVEKPLALRLEQLARLEAVADVAPGLLAVGYNRRHSKLAQELAQQLRGRGPVLMSYRVCARPLPQGHWLDDPEVGGGRLVGECGHFLDLLSYLAGDPGLVSARRLTRRGTPDCDLAVQLELADGSMGQLLYTTAGSSRWSKERLEVHAGGLSAELDDFATLRVDSGGRRQRFSGGGKGHAEQLDAVVQAVRTGGHDALPQRHWRELSRLLLELAATGSAGHASS